MSENGITSVDMDTAKKIRELCKTCDPIPEQFMEIFTGEKTDTDPANKPYKLFLRHSVFDRYLKDVPKKEVVGIVEKALELYFSGVTA